MIGYRQLMDRMRNEVNDLDRVDDDAVYETLPLPTWLGATPCYVAFRAASSRTKAPTVDRPESWRLNEADTGDVIAFVAKPAFVSILRTGAFPDVNPFTVARTANSALDQVAAFDELIAAIDGVTEEFFARRPSDLVATARVRDALRGALGSEEQGAWAVAAPAFFEWIDAPA